MHIFQGSSAPENQLLAALPDREYQRLLPHLELVSLSLRQVLYQVNKSIEHVYFPHQAIVSLVSTMKNSSTIEVGLVGNEGMVGIPVILGANSSINQVKVQVARSAMRMKASQLKTEFK
jgi:hypothetical protein